MICEAGDMWFGPACGPGIALDEAARVGGYAAARRFINRAYPGRGRLLEVGSRHGFLLAAFKADGWRVHGIDPDEACCRAARARHHVATHCVSLQDAAIPDAAFDVVVLAAPLTATEDGRRALRTVNRILRPGGHCLIDLPRPDRAAAGGMPQIAAAAGFLIVCRHSAGPGARTLLGVVSRRLGLPDAAGSRRLWLQKVMPVAAGAPRQTAEPGAWASCPAWLSREVAGMVTVPTGRLSGQVDIRRGHPWRVPDRALAAR